MVFQTHTNTIARTSLWMCDSHKIIFAWQIKVFSDLTVMSSKMQGIGGYFYSVFQSFFRKYRIHRCTNTNKKYVIVRNSTKIEHKQNNIEMAKWSKPTPSRHGFTLSHPPSPHCSHKWIYFKRMNFCFFSYTHDIEYSILDKTYYVPWIRSFKLWHKIKLCKFHFRLNFIQKTYPPTNYHHSNKFINTINWVSYLMYIHSI